MTTAGNQAIRGIPNRDSLAPQFPVNRRAQLKSGTVVFKINQVFKLSLDDDQLFFVADALQNFRQHKTAVTNFVAILKTLLQPLGLRRFSSTEKINQNR